MKHISNTSSLVPLLIVIVVLTVLCTLAWSAVWRLRKIKDVETARLTVTEHKTEPGYRYRVVLDTKTGREFLVTSSGVAEIRPAND